MQGRRIVAAAVAALAVAPAAAHAAAPKTITVMTRNLYLGGDINRPLAATAGKTDVGQLLIAFGNANYALRQIVDQTSFPTRSQLLAKEILARKPDLVGMQEVAEWRRGPLDYTHLGTPGVTSVDYDFLKTLLGDLKGTYTAQVVRQESDVEGPAFPASDPNDPNGFMARLTMRDVILKRKASKVKVLKTGSKQYKARLDVKVGPATFSFIRGYAYADIKLGAKQLRFIDTHLESETSRLADAQAKELLAGPVKQARKRAVIVVCDCNSDPLDSSVKPDDIPHKSAYDRLTKTLHDQWLKFAPASKGFTSGLSETVNDPDASGFDHRIDLVLAREPNGKAMKSVKGWITGRDPKARAANGLWASDHAGVVLKLRP
jgi:endonuclease/exonuclease/phosphatase family metal-dependent hydrolase